MPTSPSGWKELRLRLSRSSPQTIGYRPRLFKTKRTSDHGSDLSGTGRWLAPVDPRARSWLQRHPFRIGIWAASLRSGGRHFMEWIVVGFLLMHLLLLFGVLGGLLHTLFPRGSRNKSRGDRKGYSMQKAMPHGPDADLRKRGNQSPLFELDIWGQSLIPNLQIQKPATQELYEGNHEKPNRH